MSIRQDMERDGRCMCGCGLKTEIAPRTRSGRDWFKGKPKPYFGQHARRVPEVAYRVDEQTGCWVWAKSYGGNGYGFVRVAGQPRAHRYVYEKAHGPVSPELDLDHLCRNRACVNPDHLEPVSRSENLRRGSRGKMNRASIFALRLMDATTNLSRLELAEAFGLSGRTVTRYCGTDGRGRHHEKFLRGQPSRDEHILSTSCQSQPYPRIE